MLSDTRNLTDDLKGRTESEIIEILDKNGVELHIAIENLERDFNMGTIVRSANAFGVRHVHVIGRRQWNKRGAMATDKYLHVHYHGTVEEFTNEMIAQSRVVIAIDNVEHSVGLHDTKLPERSVLVFGAEGPGVSDELLTSASRVVRIEQLGSTRSINVGVAAGIVMYAWLQQNYLQSV